MANFNTSRAGALRARRRIKFGATPQIELLRGMNTGAETTLAVLTNAHSWDLEQPVRTATGGEIPGVFEVVDVDGSLRDTLKKATGVRFRSFVYALVMKQRPVEETALWRFELEPTGQRQ
jgi:hypothetical protein